MIKELKFNKEARESIKNGINILANAVKITLGPKGKCVIMTNPDNTPRVTKDGVSVAKEICLKNPFENLGAQLMKEVAVKTLNTVGDSTTTSTVIAQSIINQGFKYINKKSINSLDIIEGIKLAVKKAVDYIQTNTTYIIDDDDIKNIATISTNNDSKLGELISSTFKKIGKNGIITVEESNNSETTAKVINGMQINSGYTSQHFVTDMVKDICVLNNPYILITEQKINNIKDISFILNQIVNEHRSLLLIAEDFDDSVLETLKLNKLENILNVCAIKAPSFGEYRKEILKDIACLTKGTCITYDSGMSLKDISINFLGQCKKVNITKNDTTIIDGYGSKEELDSYILSLQNKRDEIKKDPANEDSPIINFYDKRIAKLTGGIAVIYVGGVTESEMKERKDRIDDAVAATKTAIEGGIVPGGGITYINASKEINGKPSYSKEKNIGINIVKKALLEPFNIIMKNAGLNPSKFYKNISTTMGIDANTCKYVNMYDAGIIDPSKAITLALENASSIGTLFLSTECMIVPLIVNNY